MKKLIIYIFILLITESLLAQKDNISILKNDSRHTYGNRVQKQFNSSGKFQPIRYMIALQDSLWLYGRSDMYIWQDSSFVPLPYSGMYKYYNNPDEVWYGMTKIYTGFNMLTNDSINKLNFYYNSSKKDSLLIFKKFDTIQNIWFNYSLTLRFYDKYGFDSCIYLKLWSDNNWVNFQKEEFKRNYKKAITEDIIYDWDGSNWQIVDGHKFIYFDNVDCNCTDSIWFYNWSYEINDWYNNHKWYLYYDENNVQISGLDLFYDDDLNKWRNFQRTLEYEFFNWCGCEEQWICDPKPTHLIIQNWYDSAWFNIERSNSEYDSLGGEITVIELPDSAGNWTLGEKLVKKFVEPDIPDFWLIYKWNGNEWVGYNGTQFVYIYSDKKLLERYRNVWYPENNNWGPKWKDVYSEYIFLQNTNDFEKQNELYDFQIIPNPTKKSILIKLNDEADRIKTVRVYNVTGQKMLERKFHGKRQQENLNILSLKNGVYIINVTTRQGKMMKGKFIKD